MALGSVLKLSLMVPKCTRKLNSNITNKTAFSGAQNQEEGV